MCLHERNALVEALERGAKGGVSDRHRGAAELARDLLHVVVECELLLDGVGKVRETLLFLEQRLARLQVLAQG